jgi:N-acetylglucosaminyl-diphospho-decaprenol L-rhamnosyltransferase
VRKPNDTSPRSSVTIVIVSHNSAQHLPRLKQAFRSASVLPERILVVDNASADASVATARALGFTVYEAPNNGFGAGCNVGLSAASTDFVLFCNPDVVPSPDALELLLAALLRRPQAAIAGPALRQPPQARCFSRLTANVWGFLPHWVQHRLPRLMGSYPVPHNDDAIIVDFAVGAFILCRVAALRQVDGFDETFFLYAEEEDLARRLQEHGWHTILVPSATVGHIRGTSSEGADRTVLAPFYFHSLYWYYRRYHSRQYAEFARIVLAVCVIVDCVYRTLTRQRRVYDFEASWAAFRMIDSIRANERVPLRVRAR